MEKHSTKQHNNGDTNNETYNCTEDDVIIQQSIKFIENLLDQSPDLIIFELTCNRDKIKQLIEEQINYNLLVLIIKLLRKIIESTPLNDKKYTTIQYILNETFLETLITFIATLPTQKQHNSDCYRYFWNDPDEFWLNLLHICDDLLKTIPTFGYKICVKILKSLEIYLPLFEKIFNRPIDDDIKTKLDFLLESIEIFKKQIEPVENIVRVEQQQQQQPPDDFRLINIYPTPIELKEDCNFLRPNLINGAYQDVNHYLDVHFRLLREDFIAPLRRGIQNFLLNKKLEDVRVYHRVRFLNIETIGQNYSYRIRFTTRRRYNYDNSKHFMYGSLLCFTNDSFTTIYYGRVDVRKVEDLNNGELIVSFNESIKIRFDQDYLMVESNVYLEPYYRVLTVLQQFSVENFPMEKYLIYCQNDQIEPPKYLKGDLLNLNQEIDELNIESMFNESQFVAFKAALTQEFVLIQGPPGAGKTYIGLKIVENLLKRSHQWYNESPILIICYTNHALDQFLEGLLTITDDIIRVGGQSKNKNLEKFNLREHRISLYYERLRSKMLDGKLRIIKDLRLLLNELNSNEGIIHFDSFLDVIDGYETSWFKKAKEYEILHWLLDGCNVEVDIFDINNSMKTTDINIDTDEDNPTKTLPIVPKIFGSNFEVINNLISLNGLQSRIKNLEIDLNKLTNSDMPQLEKNIRKESKNHELKQLMSKYNYLQKRLEQGRLKQYKRPSYIDLENPHKMSWNDRWSLYFLWLEQYKKCVINTIEKYNDKYRCLYKTYEEVRNKEDLAIMRKAQIIGMTTTCAARLHTTLQALKSPIVIVEEAAEILEAHIITSITKYCQHLILIGDHQQLKPNTADYRIETKYKLGISLFERMLLNHVQLYTLNVQHRMRPEIATLTTIIYPFLKNHNSVNYRPTISGTDHVLYFIDHQINEENKINDDDVDDDIDTSKRNVHEAEFLLAYANHLILNGYNTDNITIIAAYLGQMFEMLKIRKQYELLKDLRIVVLDNYQGEECDIILLSLVRSNQQNKIGFLKNTNRVCVALSRARNGLFIIGNMRQLISQSDLWLKVNSNLKKQNAIGPTLLLRCQIHPNNVTHVKTAEDFLKVAEGGCYQQCNFHLPCQHYCKKLCHVIDRDHIEYQCDEVCGRLLCDQDDTHKCIDRCYKECPQCYYQVLKRLPCGHDGYLKCSESIYDYQCKIMVSATLPCGHKTEKPCSANSKTYPCPYPCEIKVEPCGHSCVLKCHINKDPDHLRYRCEKKCTRFMKNCTQELETHICQKLCYEECDECDIIVQKKLEKCSHAYKVLCSIDVNTVYKDCTKLCTKILQCGHKCKNPCNRPCGGCNEIIDKTIEICGHILRTECSKEPDRKFCKQKCPLLLHCGHPCTKKCNEPCTIQCESIVDDSFIGDCGHIIQKSYCYMKTTNNYTETSKLLRFCTQPCTVTLKCNHKCTGNCAECYQNRLHKSCQQKCTIRLICDHQCQLPCHSACRPCLQQCTSKCVHRNCKKLCGEICTPCKLPCTRKCKHQKCKKICSVQCNMTQCRICDTNSNDIFVMLNDCKHAIENTVMQDWLQQTCDQVGFKTCPKCDTLIKTTEQYCDYIKQAYIDIGSVKKKLIGNVKQHDELRQNLLQRINKLPRLSVQLDVTNFGKFFKEFKQRLKPTYKNKRQQFDSFILNGIVRKYQLIEEIFIVCDLKNPMQFNKLFTQQLNLITKGLQSDCSDFISDQEIDDIQLELLRLLRICQLNKLEQSPKFIDATQQNSVNDLYQQLLQDLSKPSKYINDKDIQELLQRINQLIDGNLIITNYEFQQILPVINFTKTNWLKCPNGHIYSTVEYNVDNKIIKCSECSNTKKK